MRMWCTPVNAKEEGLGMNVSLLNWGENTGY